MEAPLVVEEMEVDDKDPNVALPGLEYIAKTKEGCIVRKFQFHNFWRFMDCVGIIIHYLEVVPEDAISLCKALDMCQIVQGIHHKFEDFRGTAFNPDVHPYYDWLLMECWGPKWGLGRDKANEIPNILAGGTRCIDCKGFLKNKAMVMQNVPGDASQMYYERSRARRQSLNHKNGTTETLPYIHWTWFFGRQLAEKSKPARCMNCVQMVHGIVLIEGEDNVKKIMKEQLQGKNGERLESIDLESIAISLVFKLPMHHVYKVPEHHHSDKELSCHLERIDWRRKQVYPLRMIQLAVDDFLDKISTALPGCPRCHHLCAPCTNQCLEIIPGIHYSKRLKMREWKILKSVWSDETAIHDQPFQQPTFLEWTYRGKFGKRTKNNKRKKPDKPNRMIENEKDHDEREIKRLKKIFKESHQEEYFAKK